MASFTAEEVAKHCSEGDLWMVIDGDVYDLSKFASLHPGGIPPLLDPAVAGKDATELFFGLHRASVLKEPKYARLKIGTLSGAAEAAAKVAKKKKPAGHSSAPAHIPYGEAMGTWRKFSPYYNESHERLRAAVRDFMDKEIKPHCKEWDDNGVLPTREIDIVVGRAGIFAALVAGEEGAAELFAQHGISLPGGISAKEWDYFHALVLNEEIRRGVNGCYGVSDGLIGGVSIGLPPLLKFGTKEMIEKYAVPIIKGEKRICLAISEPYAGSDVAQIRTTAEMATDGSWHVNGVKKWITGGMVADYFTTLVRTAEHGPCMLLLDRGDGSTLSTKPIKTSYSPAAATSYVEIYKNVVPKENLIGKPGMGFMQTMANFNFERWGMIVCGNRHSRMVLDECLRWALSRKVFGKALIQQPVIRYKLAEMAAAIESVHSMLEDLTYQMNNMSTSEINRHLAGPIALLKYKQTRVATVVSDNACQIFGGRAITASGMGFIVEKFQKSFKFQAILGGSEEIMADFAIRQAMRQTQDMPARYGLKDEEVRDRAEALASQIMAWPAQFAFWYLGLRLFRAWFAVLAGLHFGAVP
ncbi:apdG [Symbiodinium sp. CCMP2456]|nr:apdG [Symbiodinium sp. CCMP2456]